MSRKRRENPIDRATRLIVTLTIASGVAFLVKMAFSAWVQTFTTNAYTQNILNFDYIFSVLFLTVALLCAFSIVKYLFYELKTFIFYEDISEQQLSYEASDNAYKSIFKTIKVCLNVVFILIILVVCIEIFNDKNSWKFILSGVLLGGISFLSLFFINKEKLKKAVKISEKIESKIENYLTFAYVFFLSLFSGITIVLLSLNSNQTARILVEDSINVPIEIELKNIANSTIYIKVTNSKKEYLIDNNDLNTSESYFEVVEKNEELKSANDIDQFVGNLNKEIDLLDMSKTEYTQIYNTDLGDYLLTGSNSVEVIIVSTGSDKTKAIHFLTTVIKEGNIIKITKKKMDLKL